MDSDYLRQIAHRFGAITYATPRLDSIAYACEEMGLREEEIKSIIESLSSVVHDYALDGQKRILNYVDEKCHEAMENPASFLQKNKEEAFAKIKERVDKYKVSHGKPITVRGLENIIQESLIHDFGIHIPASGTREALPQRYGRGKTHG